MSSDIHESHGAPLSSAELSIDSAKREIIASPSTRALHSVPKAKVASGRVFADYPNITAPGIKKRGLSTSNLTHRTGFLKYYYYAKEVLKRTGENIYLDFGKAVDAFNNQKTQENLDKVLVQISLLRSNQGSGSFTDETVKRITNELVVAKFEMLMEAQKDKPLGVRFNPLSARNVSNSIHYPTQLQKAIGVFNYEKTEGYLRNILLQLFEWKNSNPADFAKHAHSIEKLTYELSSGLLDQQLVDLFSILKTDKTLHAHKMLRKLDHKFKEFEVQQDIGNLSQSARAKHLERAERLQEKLSLAAPKIKRENAQPEAAKPQTKATDFSIFDEGRRKDLLDIPKISESLFSNTQEDVNIAISLFNKNKTQRNFQEVLKLLNEWQITNNDSFNKSNGLKVIAEMMDILDGKTKQDKIKKSDGYLFLSNTLKKMENVSNGSVWDFSKWNVSKWKPLALTKVPDLPSPGMREVLRQVNEINRMAKIDTLNKDPAHRKLITGQSLREFGKSITEWLEMNPDEFNRCGGKKLLETFQKNILATISSASLDSLLADPTKLQSKEMLALTQAIQKYNHIKTTQTLGVVLSAMETLQKANPNEYERYRVAALRQEIESFLGRQNRDMPIAPASFPVILLPSSHPSKLIEQNLTFRPGEGKNAFLLIFHNPITPWSHSEISFVSGSTPVKPASFAVDNQRDRKLQIGREYLEKGTVPEDASEKQYLQDLQKYVFFPYQQAKPRATSQNFGLPPGTKDDDGELIPDEEREGYGTDIIASLLDKKIIDEDGIVLQIMDFPSFKELYADSAYNEKELAAIFSKLPTSMPAPIDPDHLPELLEQAKSRAAFQLLTDASGLTKEGALKEDLHWDFDRVIQSKYVGDSNYVACVKEVLSNNLSTKFDEDSFVKANLDEMNGVLSVLKTTALFLPDGSLKKDIRAADWLKVGIELSKNPKLANSPFYEYIKNEIQKDAENFNEQNFLNSQTKKLRNSFKDFKEMEILTAENMVNKAISPEIFGRIDVEFASDPQYADHLKSLLKSNPSSKFTEASFIPFTAEQSQLLFDFLKDNRILQAETRSNGEVAYLLKPDWQQQLKEKNLPGALKDHEAYILHKLKSFGSVEQIAKREYLGIGGDEESMESSSHEAEGIRIADPAITARLEKLCRRRKNEIQKNMNVFAGAAGGVRSAAGQYGTVLISRADKVRHFKDALVDNFLTSFNPKSFLPNLEEPRFRLELYESGGIVYKKWIPDPNGQFSQVKNVSFRDRSGEYVEGEYRRNSSTLVDGKLKSIKSISKAKFKGYEKGNLILQPDGTHKWVADKKLGQYYKLKEDPVEKAVLEIDGPLYPAMSVEKYLAQDWELLGSKFKEAEWCGSYAVRMLHSAYAHECMPEFQEILKRLNSDLTESTSLEKDSQFEKRHAMALYTLAEQYAEKMVDSEAGRKYFREMNPTAKISPRCTPDTIQEFFMGKTPGVVNSMRRAWKTLKLPTSRGYTPETRKEKAIIGAAKAGIGLAGLAPALLKAAFNIYSAVQGFFINLALYSSQAVEAKRNLLIRRSEAGIQTPRKWRYLHLAGSAAYGFGVDGIAKPFYRGMKEISEIAKDSFSEREQNAFTVPLSPVAPAA